MVRLSLELRPPAPIMPSESQGSTRAVAFRRSDSLQSLSMHFRSILTQFYLDLIKQQGYMVGITRKTWIMMATSTCFYISGYLKRAYNAAILRLL